MNSLKLTDIIKNIDAKCDYSGDLEITGVSTDTRKINKGDLFIALIGEKMNGHDYINVAQENGASAVICSQKVEANVPVLMVEDTLEAFNKLAEYYRTLLNIKVVAVTGSNGKTSTRDMIKTVLSTKYRVFSTAGNLNNQIGVPTSILRIDDSHEIAVLEIGMNHLGEISYLSKIAKPDVAVITNIGKAHIGNLGSQENILKAKLEILENLNKDGLLIINGDDPMLAGADTGSFTNQTVGIENKNADITAFNIKPTADKTFFSIRYPGGETRGLIPVLGKYNVYNSLEAMLCGAHFGIDFKSAFAALEGFKSVSMRGEKEVIGGITFIKDYYNASPDSSRVALETLSSYAKGGKTIALLGEMLELGDYSAKEHENLGKMCVDNNIDFAYFVGDDWEAFKKGMPENSKSYPLEEKEKMIEVVKEFTKTLTENDAVLIKGSRGTRMEEVFKALKEHLTNN